MDLNGVRIAHSFDLSVQEKADQADQIQMVQLVL